MEILQLKYYTTVVDEGTISRGARRLGMTQPPVSMQIRLLEEELGCTLFERGSRSIKLTEEGRLFYENAVRILSMTESASAAVRDCHNAETGTLKIGVVSSLADFAAGRWFREFHALHPLVNYELTEGSTYQLLDKLKSRMIDAAFVRKPFSARGFSCISLEPEDMLLIGEGGYLDKFPDTVTLRQAAEIPLIIYRRWAEYLDHAFASAGLKPRIICTADDVRTCISWAAAGTGVAVAPSDAAAQSSASSLKTRAIRGLAPSAETTLAVNEGGCDTAVGKKFLEYFSSSAAAKTKKFP